jgi:transposase InsO family protein/transposase-like protein
MRKPRKSYTPAEKVAILRQHLIDRVPVSDLCDQYQLPPSIFYAWQKLFFENGATAFERRNGSHEQSHLRTIAALRDKLQRKNEVVAELMEAHIQLKKRAWGTLTSVWIPHDVRDAIVDYVGHWSRRTEIPIQRFIAWLGVAASKFYDWRPRHGLATEHNALVPRDWWLESWEKKANLEFYARHPLEGYRRLTFMMLDADVVAVSPSSVYRVLHDAGLLKNRTSKSSLKGKGFEQPVRTHEHWHVDISYINIAGTFYYLCSILDGCSRFIVHWEIRETMTETDVETILQRARERFPGERPRIISDNGPQFIAKDFKEFIRICGMTHVRTSPHYPQSNGKKERWYKTLKGECIRVKTPLSLEDARRIVADFVAHYNEVRLHSAIGYIAPAAKLAGREAVIFAERDRKLNVARERRRAAREAARALS